MDLLIEVNCLRVCIIRYIFVLPNITMMAKQAKKGAGRPKTRTHAPERAAAKQTKEGEEKYIITAAVEDIEAMKNIAYWDRLTIKQAFAQAIADYKAKFEKKNGPLKQRPA